MLSFRLTERRTLLIVVDLIIVELTTLFAFWMMAWRAGWQFDLNYLFDQASWFVLLPAMWFLSALLNEFYNPQRIANLSATLISLLRTVIVVVIVYIASYFFLTVPGSLPRGVVAYQGAASFVLIALWRWVYVLLLQHPTFARRVIIVGAGWAGETMAQVILEYASIHYRIVGFVDDDPSKNGQTIRIPNSEVSLPILGAAKDLVRLTKELDVPQVIMAISHHASSASFHALLECKEQGIQITLMPTLYEQLTGRIPIEHVGDNWNVTLPLDSAEAGGFYPIAKRIFDIVGALLGLALYLPLLIILTPAIYMDSPGSIFYSQERVGKGGKVFRLLKLRTMIANAEMEGVAMRAQPQDPRVTRVGRLLRRMRLDEMPQLINILKGEMSSVGPRPERPEHLAELDRVIPFHRLRNTVKPGMAGWAVVNYDYVDSVDDARVRLEYDLYYIKHQSIGLDLAIMLRAIEDMFTLRGR
jgi:exopolysaccharide biosynthesis polyprenyl glycosylphosphotransferase